MTKYTFVPFEGEDKSMPVLARSWRRGQYTIKEHSEGDWPEVRTYDKTSDQLSDIGPDDKLYIYAHGLIGTGQVRSTRHRVAESECLTPEELADRLIASGLRRDIQQINLFMCESGGTYIGKGHPELEGTSIAGRFAARLSQQGFRNVTVIGYTQPLDPVIGYAATLSGTTRPCSRYKEIRRTVDDSELVGPLRRAKEVQRRYTIDGHGHVMDSSTGEHSYRNNGPTRLPPHLFSSIFASSPASGGGSSLYDSALRAANTPLEKQIDDTPEPTRSSTLIFDHATASDSGLYASAFEAVTTPLEEQIEM
ncbi:hypothetical protein Psal006b_00899 [Piscirickettsia salmonis]|uniref:Uncharacterized protein n=1 Tax=Piscirickettsia salmonis TaxID=1238 RepID=A0A1L6TDN0_PISSA|nr:hypothetical protein [Piscirickettsia salmonis]AKP74508.1 hypothetical protein PSLF89_2965 [Piscirickettsia salmonis LF-89 = ATCC VR-1361]ALB23477.1 hypothetical protein KU39_2299 [Piscirickettsia salmonis]ALY03355.1 hypothetical protein AWE47_11295 [Piscirickettsia salmonis]AMA42921.1 hypothetical protein AWJ11_11525 [Piscirickettsia salmonis]AOS35389.1 hypothetical protein AVM72_08650 [Piscirickettsia salmonis]